MKLELRDFDVKFQASNEETSELVVSGYVNKTGQNSKILGREKRFIERIMPGAFNSALSKGNEVDFLAEHDNKKLLSSTRNGSLALREDENGLFMEARISPTSWGKDYYQLIKDGLLTNMSFGMIVEKDKWEKRTDGLYERSIEDMTLIEVSAVKNPAYIQSTIQARSIEIIDEPQINLSEEIKMDKEKQIGELRAQLDALEGNEKAKEIRATESVPNAKETELRGVEQFLRGQSTEEVRAMTTSTGAITVPTSLSDTIIEKLVEQAELFGRARTFTPTTGTLEILREQTIGDATFIGEYENANLSDFSFDKVVLEQRRAATAIELSQQLINDSGIDIVNYAVNIMTKRLGRKLNESTLTGNKSNKEFEGILTSTEAEVVKELELEADLTLDDLLDMTLAMHPEHLEGAVFVVNRPTFNQIAKLKDNDGNYHLVRDVVNGKAGYRIFGLPVLIQDKMPVAEAGAVKVALVNMGEAYATMIKKGVAFKRISDDTTQALRGTQLLLLDIFADGKIINEEAIKFIKIAE